MKKILLYLCKVLKIKSELLFVGSTDVLPPPLSKEDEKICHCFSKW